MSATVAADASARSTASGEGLLQAVRRRVRGVPTVVWLITALQFAFLLFYATLLPTWRAPDEPRHVDLVLHVAATHNYPRFDGLLMSSSVVNSLERVHFSSRSAHLLPDDVPPRADRPPFRALGDGPSTTLNHMPQHPPLYYVTLAAAWRAVDAITPGGPQSFDRDVWVLRALSALFVLPLPLVAWAIADRLKLHHRATIVAALVPLAIPELTHIGSAVNNDSLLILLGALTMLPCMRLAAGDLRVRVSLAAGALGGLALFTKGFGFVFVAAALLAAACGARWNNRTTALKSAAVVSGSAFVFGGWWWMRNLLVFHRLQPQYYPLPPPPPGFSADWGAWGRAFTPAMFRRFWGDFGWFDVALPTLVIVVASVVSAVLVVVAFVRAPRLVSGRERQVLMRQMLVLFVPCPILVAFVAVEAASTYSHYARMQFIQGRYVFSAVGGAAALLAVGVSTFGKRALRIAPLAMVGAVIVMQSVAILRILGFYWGPPNADLKDQIHALLVWSPWPSRFLAVLAVGGAVILGATISLLVRDAASRAREQRSDLLLAPR